MHRIDSLDLLVRVVAAWLGVALIAEDGPQPEGVRYHDLDGVAGSRRGYALTRPGRDQWRANAAVIQALTGPLPSPTPPGSVSPADPPGSAARRVSTIAAAGGPGVLDRSDPNPG